MYACISKCVLALGMAAVLTGPSVGQPKGPSKPASPDTAPPAQPGIAVYLHNQAPFDIYVTTVVRVSKQWKTIAFQKVEPGQKVGPIAHTDNRVLYFHAHSEDRKTVWGAKDLFRTLSGARAGFVRHEFQGIPKSYVMNFTYTPPPDNEAAPMEDAPLHVL